MQINKINSIVKYDFRNMAKLFILSDSVLKELKNENAVNANFDFYKSGTPSVLKEEELIELKDCVIPDNLCESMLAAETNLDAAIILYEGMELSPLLASDERLWTYLTHGPLLSYVQKKWAVDDSKNKVGHILDHWFVNGHSKLMRNALASLWWSVEISKLESKTDPYRLTRILFTNYTLRVVALAQVLRSRNVLRGILEWFAANGTEKMEVRGSFIAKYLNQLASIKQLTILEDHKIVALIDDVKDVIEKLNEKEDYQNLSVSDIIFNMRQQNAE